MKEMKFRIQFAISITGVPNSRFEKSIEQMIHVSARMIHASARVTHASVPSGTRPPEARGAVPQFRPPETRALHKTPYGVQNNVE